jgi:hypothetical protein
MTTLIMMDEDHSPAGIKRRLKEEFARHGIASETEAAERYGRPQQWVSRRMTGESKWYVGELEDFCRVLGLSYVYVTTGIRPIPPRPPAQPFRLPQSAEPVRRLRPVTDVVGDRQLDLVTVDDDALAYLRLATDDDQPTIRWADRYRLTSAGSGGYLTNVNFPHAA